MPALAGSLAEALSGKLQGYQPDPTALEFAVRHLPKHMREALYHQDPWRRRNALGHLYQAVIYNRIHRICDDSPFVSSFVKQFNDVPYDRRSRGALGQNGVYYTTEGQIVVRGSGYDLGEFDGLIFGADGSLLFVEMLISEFGLKSIAEEVSYKRHLLKLLLSKEADFLLIVPEDMKGVGRTQDLLTNQRNHLSKTGALEVLPEGLASKAGLHEPSHLCTKGKLLSELSDIHPFDYEKVQAPIREAVLAGLGEEGSSPVDFASAGIIKQIILGSLDRDALGDLLRTWQLIVDHQSLSEQEFWRRCSKAVLVLKLPEGRPKLYLRVRQETKAVGPNYLKLGPWTHTTFGFERNVLRRRTAFFNLLESTRTMLSKEQTAAILGRYLHDSVIQKRKKFGERPLW